VEGLGAGGTVHQFALAIGAAIIEVFGAFGAEGAFHRTDEGAGGFGGKLGAAVFAIGAHFQHCFYPSLVWSKFALGRISVSPPGSLVSCRTISFGS
jgi:hypothetical protein